MSTQSFDSKEVKKKAAPTLFIELIDQRDSGWVLDGTAGTSRETRLTSPSAEFIPNRGYRLVKVKNEHGEEEWINQPIRYIKNSPTLSVEEQQRRNILPAKNKLEDKIIVKRGNFSVVREGAHIALYDYLLESFYNGSNPNRPDTAKALYRVIELGKREEAVNERKLAVAEAIQFLGTLYTRQGKEFRYKEDKINSLCQMFQVFAETPSGKINGLMAHAEKDPMDFLDKALRFEETLAMEVAQALELNVIRFEGNNVVYCHKDKVISNLGRGEIKHDKKVSKLADAFTREDMKAAYEEFSIELQSARDKQFTK